MILLEKVTPTKKNEFSIQALALMLVTFRSSNFLIKPSKMLCVGMFSLNIIFVKLFPEDIVEYRGIHLQLNSITSRCLTDVGGMHHQIRGLWLETFNSVRQKMAEDILT